MSKLKILIKGLSKLSVGIVKISVKDYQIESQGLQKLSKGILKIVIKAVSKLPIGSFKIVNGECYH